jgi:hypothetical protein
MKSAAISAYFLFGDRIGRILFTGLKDVFQRATVLGRALVTKQLDGYGQNQQQEGDHDCSDVGHGAIVFVRPVDQKMFQNFFMRSRRAIEFSNR